MWQQSDSDVISVCRMRVYFHIALLLLLLSSFVYHFLLPCTMLFRPLAFTRIHGYDDTGGFTKFTINNAICLSSSTFARYRCIAVKSKSERNENTKKKKKIINIFVVSVGVGAKRNEKKTRKNIGCDGTQENIANACATHSRTWARARVTTKTRRQRVMCDADEQEKWKINTCGTLNVNTLR